MTRARVLVVDDEPGMLRAVERILRAQHDVRCASSAAEALAMATDEPPELAILDIRMPGADGFELMGQLKERWPDLDVIMMTGSLGEADAHLIRAIREKAFYFVEKPFDREVLRTLIERCLELRRLRETHGRHLRRLEAELEQARKFQQGLLPPQSGGIEGFRLDARYLSCDELGGDLYDYASAGPGRVALMIADVSGHGASAAMLTAMVKAAFRASHVDGYDPLAVLDRIHTGIAAFSYEKFLSLICVRLSRDDASLEFANAGHPPGLVWGDGRAIEALPVTGPIVSPALGGGCWKRGRIDFRRGDGLLLFTDGVTETRGGDDFFEEQRVRDVVEAHRAGGSALLNGLLEALRTFSAGRPASDDVTLLTATKR